MEKLDRKREALWVIKFLDGRFMGDVHGHKTVKVDVDDAYGYYYKKDAQLRASEFFQSTVVGRRREFRAGYSKTT